MDSAAANLTHHEAERLMKHYEILAGSGNPDRIAESFASDVIVRFAVSPRNAASPSSSALLLPEASKYLLK